MATLLIKGRTGSFWAYLGMNVQHALAAPNSHIEPIFLNGFVAPVKPAMVKRHVKGGKAMKKFGGQKSKSQPWKVKSVIQKATAKSEVTTTPKPTKPDVKMAPAKAEKASKLSKKDRRKQRAEAVKVGERSPKATPQASPKAKIASPPKTPAGSPKMSPEMEVDAEKTKKQRRKDQRRNIQVKKTQMKKKGNY